MRTPGGAIASTATSMGARDETMKRKPAGTTTFTPHAIARVALVPTTAGGRKTPIGAVQHGCPVSFEGFEQFNDCYFLFDRIGIGLAPGASPVTVPIRFFALEMLPVPLSVGLRMFLFEGRKIGQAEITEVLPP